MATCSRCGRENPAGARFCNHCGGALAVGEDAGREARKPVTLLFCDVVGSTELGERVDAEVLRGVMSRFYAAVRAPVERHGGTVEKVIGDALVAVFGIPVVHEDDALRAVRAALEARDAVRRVGEVRARIGVNTGDVLARDPADGESLVVGDAVNVAARLQQAAGPDEVLVGEATWGLVAHAATGTRVAPIAAKGKRESLAAWLLESVEAGAAGHRRRFDLPLVGREEELDLLAWAVRRARSTRRPHLVTVTGEPGIGKSRLIAELGRLGHELEVLVGQCRPTSGSAVEPLLEVARSTVPRGRASADAVAAILRDDPDAAAVAACLDDADSAGVRDVAWAVTRLVGALADRCAVAVALEDVHWADDLVLEVVEQLVSGGRGRRALLVVCTARTGIAGRRAGWGQLPNSVSIALDRLDDTQTRRLLSNASPGLDEAQAAKVVATAEGNPLFAEHLAVLLGDDAGAGLPRSIQMLLAARLEAVPAPEREVALSAAVAGREFPAAWVEEAVGGSVDARLAALEQRELVERAGDGRWRFAHALLRDAAYDLLPKGRRGELHAALARWAAARGGEDGLIGDHLDHAYRLRVELGRVDDETAWLRDEAGDRLAAAGRRADAIGDPLRARQLLERALELSPAGSPAEASAMVELAAAGWDLLGRENVRRLLEAGAERAGALGLRALELRAQIVRLGTVTESAPDTMSDREILVYTRAALDELEQLGDERALAAALCTLGECEWVLGQAEEAVNAAGRALDIVRSADQDVVWALRLLVGAVLDSPIPLSDGDALLAGLMGDLAARPTARQELLRGQAMIAHLRGEERTGRRLLDATRELERELRRSQGWQLDRILGVMLAREGRDDEALAALGRYAEELERRGAPSSAGVTRAWIACLDAAGGRLDDARLNADRAAAVDTYEAPVRAEIARVAIALADASPAAAVHHGRRAVATADAGDWPILRGDAAMALGRALHASGQQREAADSARIAVEHYRRKEYPRGVERAQELLAAAPAMGG
jgi:class 3 adenylate cyclase/tetratricopeptide (TPR) repeat protein